MAGVAIYGQEIRDEILARIAQGEHLSAICESDPDRMPGYSTVFDWGESDEWKEAFLRARRKGFQTRAEQLGKTIADETISAETRKLRSDYERWYLSKMAPMQFGDRTALQMLDEHGKPAKAGITIVVDGAPGE